MEGGEIHNGADDEISFDSCVTAQRDNNGMNMHRTENDCERDVEEGRYGSINYNHIGKECVDDSHGSKDTQFAKHEPTHAAPAVAFPATTTADPSTHDTHDETHTTQTAGTTTSSSISSSNNNNNNNNNDDNNNNNAGTTTSSSISSSNNNNNNNNNDDNNNNNNNSQTNTISFREIQPGDRILIQELFEEWFPVEYKDDFYDNLCQHRTMGPQKLYTIVATTTPASGREQIIGCLLGCKLTARKLSPSSRRLLLPSFQPRNKTSVHNHQHQHQNQNHRHQHRKNIAPHDETEDEINRNPNPGDDEDEDDENLDRTKVFYIMTLGVIEEYRNRGLASYLLERALDNQIITAPCELREEDSEPIGSSRHYHGHHHHHHHHHHPESHESFPPPQLPNNNSNNNNPTGSICETAYLHVIIDNEAAIRFYEKLGFERLREIVDYYTIDDEKHNCFLYARFFDRASVLEQQQKQKQQQKLWLGLSLWRSRRKTRNRGDIGVGGGSL
eukprot:CAMPEP_0172377980 /NCGR_PEP_ID=MMETSP1060-20121228/69188_1 /TAXON_ID=37318 /ORGANISM="Pseudo-nitzschia pungens, Strain cf. cingulata" /LENGTH=500 /DNA_ID=CAMNT_0013105691 /DNA_START=276 /DNA_END=1774 /DNA_ORIENTATION=-